MNILIISGIYPKRENKAGGIFITRRCIELKNKNINYDLFTISSRDSFFIKVLKQIFNKKYEEKRENLIIDGVKWNNIFYEKTLIKTLSEKINRNKLILNRVKCIEKSVDLIKYDLIHAHWTFPEGFIAKKIKDKYGIPYIITAHGSDIHTNPFKDANIKKYTVEALENADKVIFVSKGLLNSAKQIGYSGKNSVIMPNGIDVKQFRILNKDKIKQDLELTNKVIGFVGNLEKVKRVDKLPEIFKYINDVNKNIDFLVVGEGTLKENIIKECKKKNLKVKFVGRINPDEVPNYMNACDIIILPSRNEGFPCVVLEANACGVPVIGSNNGGIPEAIDNYKMIVEEGIDFEKRFSQKVMSYIDNVQDENKLRNKSLIYSWDKVVEKECLIYKKIMNKM